MIGAGAAGLATAWELLGQGCKVEVFEASNGIAEGASFASTGFLGAASLTAWDMAGLPPVRPGATASLLPPTWARSVPGMVFWRQRLSQQSADRQNTLFQAAHALAQLNIQRIESHLHDSLQEVESTQGAVIAWRTDEQRRLLQAGLERLRQTESPVHELDPALARSLDTAVNPELAFAGAFGLPTDRVINGRQWLAHLKNDILQLGGQVHFRARVTGLTAEGIVHLAPLDAEPPKAKTFDAVVVCAASSSTGLLKPLGVELPMLVLNHCALSAPVREATHAPSTVWMDAQERIIISRTGQRLRASGGVLVPGAASQATFKTLYRAIEDWFPGAATLHGDKALVQTWQASVGHTPDGLPLVGRTAHSRIWVNAAHGGRGWTFGAGAAKLLAELMTGQTTSLDPASFAPQRTMRA